MEKVILDASLGCRFEQADSQLQICNEAGRTIGYFVPVGHSPELYEWAKAQISDEELDRRRKEPGGRSTEEVLKRLAEL